VVQFHTWGMRRMKTEILNALVKVYSPKCIYEKSSEHTQKKEGFEVGEQLVYGTATEEVEIVENGFKFLVNIPKGQKTGFFLDQRQNRNSVSRFVKGLNMLNAFAYTGGFSVYAASVAKKVTTLDISKGAVEAAKKNFEINGFDPNKHEFVAEDAFEYLKKIKPGQFDCILPQTPSPQCHQGLYQHQHRRAQGFAQRRYPDQLLLHRAHRRTDVHRHSLPKCLARSLHAQSALWSIATARPSVQSGLPRRTISEILCAAEGLNHPPPCHSEQNRVERKISQCANYRFRLNRYWRILRFILPLRMTNKERRPYLLNL